MRLLNKKRALVEEKKCVICNRIFFRRVSYKSHRINIGGVRKAGCKTCSEKCSKKYLVKFHKEKHKIKIHKRYQKNVIIGETMKCGLLWFNISPHHSWKWKDVTCKNCLKARCRK